MKTDQSIANEVEQTATKFAYRHIKPVAMEADHAAPKFPMEIFIEGLKAGFDRLVLPETSGGYGFQTTELCTLIKTLAQTCAGHAMVFGVHAAALKSLVEAGGKNADDLIKQIIDSQRPIAVVIPEPLPVDDFDTNLTVASDDEKSLFFSGPAGLAVNADPSGFIVAFAKRSDGHPLALLIDSKGNAFKLGSFELTLGLRAMPIAELALDRHLIPQAFVIADGKPAVDFYRALLCNLSIVTAAAALGLMTNACDKALAYANERYQGGKMIIDHSHLRNILGQMSAGAVASWGAVFYAASQQENGLSAIETKVIVTECAVKTCTDAVQILGGYGYMRDYGLEKAMRDAAVLALLPISNARAELMITAIRKEKLP